MSIRALQAVLQAAITPPTLKLTAVVLANALNEKSLQLNLSMRSIGEAVGVDRRQAQRYVQALISLGLLSVILNAKGGPPGSTPHYRMHLDRLAAIKGKSGSGKASTGDADDTPTDDIHDTPPAGQTGDMEDADGRCTGQGRVTYRAQTGGVRVTQTGMKRKEPEGKQGLQQTQQLDGFDTAPSADAETRAGQPVMGSSRKVKAAKPKQPTKTGATWEAYRVAYFARYRVEPVSNAKVNGMLAQLVDRLGSEEAPLVAGFYVEHPGPFYSSKAHTVDWLLKDAEKLRTEWATGGNRCAGGNAARPGEPRRVLGFGDGPNAQDQALADLTARALRRLDRSPAVWGQGEVIDANEL